jgi:hypothetical protein
MRSQEGKKKSIMWQKGKKVGSSRCGRKKVGNSRRNREKGSGVNRRYFDSGIQRSSK